MITEDAIMTSIAKAMQDQIDREIIESLGLKFRLGRYLGEPGAVSINPYIVSDVELWILQQSSTSWQYRGTQADGYKLYTLDEQLYTLFLLRWS